MQVAALTVGDAAVAAVAAVLTAFELMLLYERPREREHLWLAAISGFTAIFAIAMAAHYNAGPELALTLTKVEGSALLCVVHAVPAFAQAFTKQPLPIPKRALGAAAVIWAALAWTPWMIAEVQPMAMPILDHPFYRRPQTPLLVAAQIYGMGVVLGGLFWLIRHRKQRRDEARYWMIAFAGWAATSSYMFVASVLSWPMPASVVEYGVLFFAAALVAKDAREHAVRLGEVERAHADAASRRIVAEALYREIIDSVGEGVTLVDGEGRVRLFNPVMVALTGLTEEEARGERLVDLLELEDERRDAFEEHRKRASPDRVEEIGLVEDEPRRKLLCSFTAFVPSEGEEGTLVILRDDTEREELLVRMMEVDRMVAVGTLAAGIGHEINNPLSYVLVNLVEAERVVAQMPETARSDIAELVDRSCDGAKRIREIVSSLRSFSRQDEKLGAVDAGSAMRAALRIASNEIRHRASLVVDIQPTPPVRANAARLGQVFVNLLINAAQSIPEGSKKKNVAVKVHQVDGMVSCEVSDTGRGLPQTIRERIFEPFFTTKPVGEGTGLGLSIARDTVQALGGRIDVESEADEGTTFRVVLPALEGVIADPSTPPPPTPSSREGLRVLLVDDEVELLRALRRALRGLEVDTCGSGEEALERLTNGEVYDVIVTDLMMPEMSGMELYAALESEHPRAATATLFMTGGAFTAQAQLFCETHADRVLDKPVDTLILRDRIVELYTSQHP